jgi:hypothetical protein
VIIAADVLYERAKNPTLVSLLENILAPDGVAVRRRRPQRGPTFFARHHRGFAVKLFDEHNRLVGVPAVGHYQRFVVRRA